ncbi:MAG TPA: 50S ribosomal protein L30 [Candidatus Korarchaeota archaeon]|nr:50S ribosomal protein L30 [Candidatus Korarchaeota archaeon]
MSGKGSEGKPLIVVVRIRGRVGVRPDIRQTMDMLHVRRKFWATVVPASDSFLGMLFKVKDYTTYGEINRETLVELLRRRGELKAGGKLTDEWLRQNTEFQSIEELADAMLSGKVKLNKLGWLKPYFRLHPPSGGFKRTTKRGWRDGGELGYRGSAINELLRRMM